MIFMLKAEARRGVYRSLADIRTAIRKIFESAALRDYLLATAAVLLAFALRRLLDPWLGNNNDYLTFILAVAFTGLYTRLGPSVYATFLGAGVAYFCFVQPRYKWGFEGINDAAGFIVYLFAAIGVLFLTHARNRAVKRTESSMAELQESEARFRTLADNMAQLAWMADEKGWIFWYNRRWLDYTGTTQDEVQGWGWRKAHHPDHVERVVASMQRSWDSGEPWEDTFPLRGADGAYRWFLSRAVPIRDAAGRIVRWFGTNTDITERMNVEQALRRSEKLAAAGKLAASVAHELNNPLAVAINLAFLARNESNDVARSRYIEGVERALKRASMLANRTLNFYHDNRNRPVAMREVADEVISVFEPRCIQHRIKIIPEISPEARVSASRDELRQVVVNLLSNAVDAIRDDGVIRLRVTTRKAVGNGQCKVHLIVADSGCGIDPRDRAKIFDPFFTTKGSVASGLGLWITKGVVLNHGGAISVRCGTSSGHRGTVVTISFPALAETQRMGQSMAEDGQKLLGGHASSFQERSPGKCWRSKRRSGCRRKQFVEIGIPESLSPGNLSIDCLSRP